MRTVAPVGLIIIILLFFAVVAYAQPIAGTEYTSQLNDTLPHLAQKYLGNSVYTESIRLATRQILGSLPPHPLPPGFRLFIPDRIVEPPVPVAPSPTPVPAGPPPAGKIAFSFYNRALARRVWEINFINVDGSNRQVFKWNEVSEPALSPDGTHLAFRGWHDTGHGLVVGPITGERYWPVGNFQEDSRADWSHDGSRLVFASQRESDRLWRLYFIHANGEGERILARLDNQPLFGEDPAWATGDNRIVYRGCAPDGSQCGLWFVTLDGAVSAPVVLDPGAIQPDASPTAEEVVFASAQTGNWEIYRVNLDGSDLKQLTSNVAIDGMPVWSPDGAWIAFQSSRPGAPATTAFETGPTQGGQSTEDPWGIWIMRPDGSDLRQVFAFDGGLMKANRLDLPYGARDWYDEQISWSR